jgi:tetratricopeptide (TPR) repeat protein
MGLTKEIVFHVLAGQIAAQRGNHRLAFQYLLEAAQLVRDGALAEKATRSALAWGDEPAIGQGVALWLDIAPDSLAAHQIAAFVRLRREDLDGAMYHLRRLVNLTSDEGESGFVQLARLVHKLRPPGQRMELMELLTQGEPENADAWFARALVAAGAERNDEAVEAARRATELRPDWTEPRLFLVQLLKDLDRKEEARATLERFVAEHPRDQGLRTLYAQFLVDDKELDRAREVFAAMLVESPREPDVLFALGILSLELEDLVSGRDYFTRLRETEERRDDAAYYLGRVEELDHNPEVAAKWYEKVRGAHSLDARIRLARIEAQGGDLDKARERLRQLRDQNRKQAVLLFLVEAELLTEMDRKPEAMKVYDAALVAHPDDPELLYARGLHGATMQRLEVVEADLRRLLELDPDHADALNALGYSLADMTDRYAEALELIQRALAIKPNEGAILDSMGWVQYRLGNLGLALDYLRQAGAKLPEDPEVAAHLGEVLWALGQRDEARQVWEKAQAKAPDHPYLLRVISRHRATQDGSAP